MIEVRCYGSLLEAAFLRDEVNALNAASARPDPFSAFEFFENFLCYDDSSARGQDLQLWFLAAFDTGRLIGYLALKRVTHSVLGFRASKLDFLVTHDADRPQLIARPEHARAVSEACYAYLLQRKHEWSFLEFRQQEAGSPLSPPPVAIKRTRYWVGQWPSMDNGTIVMQWDSLQTYFKSFSKKFRSNVSRQMRSLLAAGEVAYMASSDPAATPVLFDLYCDIERRSWKSRAGVDIGRHAHWPEYFRGLLNARQPMRISIHLVLLDGVPVAGLINGVFDQGLYALHIVSDDAHSHLAPGSAVLLMGMREALTGGYRFFNLLSGFGYYKARWQAQMTETRNVQIYQLGTPFFWHRILGDLKRRLFPKFAQRSNVLFNPMHREVLEHNQEHAGSTASKGQLSTNEREHIAALIVKVRRGTGEFMNAAELAALMPFETQRPAVKKS